MNALYTQPAALLSPRVVRAEEIYRATILVPKDLLAAFAHKIPRTTAARDLDSVLLLALFVYGVVRTQYDVANFLGGREKPNRKCVGGEVVPLRRTPFLVKQQGTKEQMVPLLEETLRLSAHIPTRRSSGCAFLSIQPFLSPRAHRAIGHAFGAVSCADPFCDTVVCARALTMLHLCAQTWQEGASSDIVALRFEQTMRIPVSVESLIVALGVIPEARGLLSSFVA